MKLEEGILLIDKPSGMTSFDVIRNLRRSYSVAHSGAKAPKLGHAGTLDPLATGLMVLGVGKGTKELANLVKLDKEYIAEILIGESRTTGDMEGEIVESKKVQSLPEEEIVAALQSMLGTLTLPVSAYSAIKVDGRPMYKRARAAERRGQTLGSDELPIRDMLTYEAELLDTDQLRGLTTSSNITRKSRGQNTKLARSCTAVNRGIENDPSVSGKDGSIYRTKESVNRAIHRTTEMGNNMSHSIPIDWNSRQLVRVRFSVGSGTYIRSLAEEFGKRLGDYPSTLYRLRRTKVGEFDIVDAHQLDEF